MNAIRKPSPDGRRIRRNGHALRRLRGAARYRCLEYQPGSEKKARDQTDSASRCARANSRALRLRLFQNVTCRFRGVYAKFDAIRLLWVMILITE